MVTDNTLIDLTTVFNSQVVSKLPSTVLDIDAEDHIIPYYLPQMRLAVYIYESAPFDVERMERVLHAAGYYALFVPMNREAARGVMHRYAHTVYWTAIDDSGHGLFKLHEPKLFGDVGHDIAASKATTIPAKGFTLIESNVRLQMPPTIYGWITARSSTARKLLMIPNGILDAGYRGPLFAQVLNMTDKDVHIEEGDRVAQVIFQRRVAVDISYVDSFWLPSERDEDGFGSTGR